MKKKGRSNFLWLSTTIKKTYHCPCDLRQAETHNFLSKSCYDRTALFNVKFFSGSRGPRGPDLLSPFGRKFFFFEGECNLNQSKDDSFVERVAKNNNWNNGNCHKIQEIFLINCFVFVITLVWKTVHNLAMTLNKAHLMEKTLQLTVPR